VAAAAVLLLLLGLELGWRSLGHQPQVVDNPALWAIERQRLERTEAPVVLVGASRIQLGFDLDVFRQRYPDRPIVQLAVDGLPGLATLEELADDDDFHGLVICSLNAIDLEPTNWSAQQRYVEQYRDQTSLTAGIDRRVTTTLQQWLVVVNPGLGLRRVTRTLADEGRLPEPTYVTSRADRSRSADYRRTDVAEQQRYRTDRARAWLADHRPLSPEQWRSQLDRLETNVRAIQSRGGRVVLVKMPLAGEYLRLMESTYPRQHYWDRLQQTTSAQTLHFADVPALRGFDLPDFSHLDYRDARHFTHGLLDELAARGVLPPPANPPGPSSP
jgi:hypothetical protein